MRISSRHPAGRTRARFLGFRPVMAAGMPAPIQWVCPRTFGHLRLSSGHPRWPRLRHPFQSVSPAKAKPSLSDAGPPMSLVRAHSHQHVHCIPNKGKNSKASSRGGVGGLAVVFDGNQGRGGNGEHRTLTPNTIRRVRVTDPQNPFTMHRWHRFHTSSTGRAGSRDLGPGHGEGAPSGVSFLTPIQPSLNVHAITRVA